MFEKADNRELIGRNELEKSNSEVLKEFHLSHIKKWGQAGISTPSSPFKDNP